MQTVANPFSPSNDEVYNDLAESRSSFESVLDDSVMALVEKACVNIDSLNRFYALREQVLSWVKCELEFDAPPDNSMTWAGWGWQPYVNEPEIRIGLLRVYKNDSVPIHDHPGASGMLVILEGELTLNEYQLEQSDQYNQMQLASLSMTGQQNLVSNQYALITPDQANLHSLSAASDVCIILDVLLTPYAEEQRSWFTPVTDKVICGQTFTAFRVDHQTFSNSIYQSG